MARSFTVLAAMLFSASMLLTGRAGAAVMPGPKPEERALTAVPGFANAAAVYLERRGRMIYKDDAKSSMLEIYDRLKVLNKEGTAFGSISIHSSNFFRVKEIQGRTHLPDGRVVELAKDSQFDKKYSDYYDTTIRSCALPEVVPGAIVEYSYRIYFDDIFYPTPWYFQAGIPTLSSTIAYEFPGTLGFRPIKIQTLPNVPIEEELTENVRGRTVTFSARSLPPIPDEPDSFPFSALSSRVLLLPVAWMIDGAKYDLLTSWEKVAEMVWTGSDTGYTHALRGARKAKAKGKELMGGRFTAREKAAAVYRFVRDEIDSAEGSGIWIGERTADDVLDKRSGDSADKALLLYAMLDGQLAARLGWTADRTRTYIKKDVINPAQFDAVLVVLDLPDGRVFLDPTDRSAGFGVLGPDYQNVPCLLAEKKKVEWVTTPTLSADASTRLARLELAVDDGGVVAGTGTLHLTGNHAWQRLMWKPTADETKEGWQKWVEGSLAGFDITELTVTEDIEKAIVDVGWKMRQRAEEVLGDECSVEAARPLRVATNPYSLTTGQRQTPVQIGFADTDRVELSLSWPEGWVVEKLPAPAKHQSQAGSYELTVESDAAARRAVATRSLVIGKDQLVGAEAYNALRELLQRAVAGDAGALQLARE